MSANDAILDLREQMSRSIIGQEQIVERLIIGLLANGNLLVEGLPGLAKTRAVRSLATNMEAEFSRIQFTPDLLPGDRHRQSEVFLQADRKAEFSVAPWAHLRQHRSSPTRSTARRPRCRRRCSRRWRSAR